jgi:DNA-directed RNA polymerase subunit RPC12/RpoP
MLKSVRLQLCAAEGVLEALKEMPYIACTWCGGQTMWPIKGFLENGGWALIYRCEQCRGEHIEHAGMWVQVDRRPRTVSANRTHSESGGGGDLP